MEFYGAYGLADTSRIEKAVIVRDLRPFNLLLENKLNHLVDHIVNP